MYVDKSSFEGYRPNAGKWVQGNCLPNSQQHNVSWTERPIHLVKKLYNSYDYYILLWVHSFAPWNNNKFV